MALSSLGAVLALRLWRAELGVPFEYSGDATYMLMSLKSVFDHGWYEVNPSLGAPFGQELYDYPFLNGDNLNIVVVKLLGLFSSDPAVALNVFFLLTFPAVALSAFLVLRRLGISAATALVFSVLYTLLPYHFLRGEGHLFLSSYYAVPLACLLVLSVYSGEPLFTRSAREGGWGRGRWISRRSLATVALCVVIGSAGVYYAAFAIVLLATATPLGALARQSRGTLATGAALVALIVGTLVVHFGSTLVYLAAHGANPEIERDVAETERFSLRLIQLLLPVFDHRLAPLADLKREYESGLPPTESSWATLGLLGSVGFLVLLGVAIVRVVVEDRRRPQHVLVSAAVATLIAFVFATTGGLGAVTAHVLTPWLRGWNRISIFLAFFSLLAVAVLLERLRTRLGRVALAWPALLGGVLILGVLDQTTDAFVRPYGAVAAEYRSDQRFFAALDRRLAPGAAVFQFPHVSFPELEYFGRRADYDSAKAYVHSERLRWSYGAMRGRPADWATKVGGVPIRILITSVVASGFDGILVDRFAYTDAAAALEGELRGVLDARPYESSNGRLSFFDARRYAARLRRESSPAALAELRAVTLRPVHVRWGEPFDSLESKGLHSWRWATERRAELTLENPSSRARDVVFRTVVASATGTPADVRVGLPGGSEERLSVTVAGTTLERRLRLLPGRTRIELSTNAPGVAADRRTLYVRLIDTSVLEAPSFPFYAPVGLKPPG